MRIIAVMMFAVAGLLAGCSSAGPKSAIKNGAIAPAFEDTIIDKEYLWVRGFGAAGEKYTDASQRKIMSREAAIASAQLRATEYLKGAMINSRTQVTNGVTDDQQIVATVSAAITHAEVVSAEYTKDDGCTVIMRLGLEDLNKSGILLKQP